MYNESVNLDKIWRDGEGKNSVEPRLNVELVLKKCGMKCRNMLLKDANRMFEFAKVRPSPF